MTPAASAPASEAYNATASRQLSSSLRVCCKALASEGFSARLRGRKRSHEHVVVPQKTGKETEKDYRQPHHLQPRRC